MKFYNKSEGFTLIELLVTIAIIGILSTLATTAVNATRSKAMITKAQSEVNQIFKAIQLLENDTEEWPGHQAIGIMTNGTPAGSNNEICADGCTNNISSGVAGITQDDNDSSYDNWDGPYMVMIPVDPWGNEYFFDTDYDHPEHGWVVVVGSYGPNGLGNNSYDSDDIVKVIN
ncbi:MAG: hypothetical protein CMI53_00450 [Parcubacteria group bacterium]|nr:hypothetical protein [Parcubacteria group bacterium]|tara:strand:- start:4144 stop:4662 length:519 start_codon:yes stop_codon:yes gene_type:complete